jgi:hypothetical protein
MVGLDVNVLLSGMEQFLIRRLDFGPSDRTTDNEKVGRDERGWRVRWTVEGGTRGDERVERSTCRVGRRDWNGVGGSDVYEFMGATE